MGTVARTHTYELANADNVRALVDVHLDAHNAIIGVSLKTRTDPTPAGRWSPPWARVGNVVPVTYYDNELG